jgi:predicted nucleic-acid-binding Zn-ribbon protein
MSASKIAFACAKCKHTEYETEEIRTTGKYSRFFDVQNKKFMAVSCAECGYTEIYKGNTSKLGNIFDFFASG